MSMITFNIEATMEEARVHQFCSMLKYMENNSDSSEKTLAAIGCGGDSNFHPKFKIDMKFNSRQPKSRNMIETNIVREYARNLCNDCSKKLAGFLSGYKLVD